MAHNGYKLKLKCICMVLPYMDLFGMVDYDLQFKGYFLVLLQMFLVSCTL